MTADIFNARAKLRKALSIFCRALSIFCQALDRAARALFKSILSVLAEGVYIFIYAAILAVAYLAAGYAAAQAGHALPGHAQLVDFITAITGRLMAGRGG